MKKRFFMTAVIVMATLWWISSTIAEEKKIDSAFVTAKCSACHTIDKVCSKIGKKTDAEWEKIVKNMVERGAKLDDLEQKGVSDFIVKLPKEKNPLCP